jgi:4-diphosphocytidyl-2-C-methyl-D-erythritol kinase
MIEALAPAKINRELRVGARRPDGYHAVRSRLATIDLCDRLTAEDGGEGIELRSDAPGLPQDSGNLVVRAAERLSARLGIEPRVRILVEKRIPVGAGLGGGSADAAVALRLLARLWQARLSESDLLAVAAELGSDVPFFLTGGEADIAGRGEQVTAREDAPPTELILLVPPFSLSTSAVYAEFDRLREGTEPVLPASLEIESSRGFFGPNDLASAVLALKPEMSSYLDSAREIAEEHAITGSGSAVVLRGFPAGTEGWLSRRHPGAEVLRCRTLGREEHRRRTLTSGGFGWTSLR